MGTILQFVDGLRNAVTGMGTRHDVTTKSVYVAPIPMTQDQIDAAYRGSGLMRKIITIPALDMAREWRDWKLEAEEITTIEAEERRLGIPQKIRQAEILRRLGGGAIILGLPGEPSQPAPNAAKGSLAYVNVVSRWQLQFRDLNSDLRDPGFGEPAMWQMTLTSGQQVDIHPSRVVPFRADTTAYSAMRTAGQDDAFWGESTVAQVLEAVSANDTARDAFKALMHKARTTRVGIPKLMELVSTTNGERNLQTRMEILRQAESIHNLWIYDAGDGEGKGGEAIDDVTYSFAGAKDVLNAYGEWVAAIADIPATRLLGRAPEGMNASGDSQQRDWQKKIRAMQTLDLAPCLDRIDRYLIPSALGTVPDGQWYDFAPLGTPSEKERAEIFKIEMEASEKALQSGVIPDQAAAKGFQSMMIDRGYWPELESALEEIPEDERYGIVPEMPEEGDPDLVVGERGPGAAPPLNDGGSRTSGRPFEDGNPYRWGAGPRGGQFKSGPGGGGSPKNYVARAVSDPGKAQKQRPVGQVSASTARLVKAKTGIDIAGQEIRLDHGSLAHAWKNHGPNGVKLRGRSPLRETDLLSAAGKLNSVRDIRPGKTAGYTGQRFEVRTTRRGKRMTIIYETNGKGVFPMNAWFGE